MSGHDVVNIVEASCGTIICLALLYYMYSR